MASKRRIRRKSCDGKKQHDTQDGAQAHKRHLAKLGVAYKGEYWTYRCEFCKKWHVGHPPKKLLELRQFYSDK